MRLEAEKIRNVTPGTLEEAMLIEKIKKSVFERLSRKGKGTLSDAFRKFDVDHDGQVTYDEFRNGMKNLDSRLTDGHIDILLSQFDKDSSGSIDYREFVANAAEQSDENIMLTPPVRMSLEQALEFIEDDELVEVTPENIRLRKKLLKEHERRRASRDREAS